MGEWTEKHTVGVHELSVERILEDGGVGTQPAGGPGLLLGCGSLGPLYLGSPALKATLLGSDLILEVVPKWGSPNPVCEPHSLTDVETEPRWGPTERTGVPLETTTPGVTVASEAGQPALNHLLATAVSKGLDLGGLCCALVTLAETRHPQEGGDLW